MKLRTMLRTRKLAEKSSVTSLKSDTVYLLHDHHLGIVVMPHYPPRSPVLSPNNTRGGVGPPSDGTKHHPYRLFSPYVHRWD